MLSRLDNRQRLSGRTRGLAVRQGFDISWNYADCGRRLKDYAPVKKVLLERFGSLEGKRILHLGSSTGVLTKHLQNLQAVAVGFDISKNALKIAKSVKNKSMVGGNAALSARAGKHLPFKDNSFDCFVSDHFLLSDYFSFEHEFPDYSRQHSISIGGSVKALEDLHRILKPGGIGVIAFYTADSYFAARALILKAGFEIAQAKPGLPLVLRKKP